jgi:hypothetical protein
VAALEKNRQPYCLAPMVDLHPASLSERNHSPNVGPFTHSRYFDAGPYYTFPNGSRHPVAAHRGIRQRLLECLALRYPAELAAIVGKVPPVPPDNIKSPLLLHGAGRVRRGSHVISGDVSGRINVALAHFKFYPGLDAKIAAALRERQYFRGSIEYRLLALALRKLENEDMRVKCTREFDGPDSLAKAHLLPTLLA